MITAGSKLDGVLVIIAGFGVPSRSLAGSFQHFAEAVSDAGGNPMQNSCHRGHHGHGHL